MAKSRKIAILILIIFMTFATIQTVIAQGIGIDLIGLAQQKAASLVGLSTTPVSSQLEQTKQQTITDTIDYINRYINDVKQSIDEYTNQETEAAKQKIKNKGQEVEITLDEHKQEIINDAKSQVKIKIDIELNKKLEELDNDLKIKIQEKFNE